MPGEMTKHVAPEIAGDADEGEARNPARDPPQEIIGSDQRHEKSECQPYACRAARPAGEAVDQRFHAILRTDGTGYRSDDSRQYGEMGGRTAAQIAQHERKRAVRVS